MGNGENLIRKDPPGEHFLFYEFLPNLPLWGTYCSDPESKKNSPKYFGITKVKILGNGENLEMETPPGEHFSRFDFFRILTPWGTSSIDFGKKLEIFFFYCENLNFEKPPC